MANAVRKNAAVFTEVLKVAREDFPNVASTESRSHISRRSGDETL
jgi:hypothetical protein